MLVLIWSAVQVRGQLGVRPRHRVPRLELQVILRCLSGLADIPDFADVRPPRRVH
jgi:hypothetical protein